MRQMVRKDAGRKDVKKIAKPQRGIENMLKMVRKGAGRKDVKKIAKPQRGIENMLKAVGGAV
jgi:glycerol-3-phosphate acyltransferase PlsY